MLDTPATYASKLTGGGRSAIAVICVLGPGAAAAIARCFVRYQRSPKPGHELAIDRIYYGDWIGVHPAATTSGNSGEGLVVCRTADERFEIHCHGGAAAIDTILNDLAQCGCEIVPCWDHPKLLPSISLERQCLEVLVQTKTATTAAIAQAQYQGALRTAYEQLLQSIEVNDKPSALAQTKRLLDIATVGEHLVEPFRVALLGQPNAGKSSLLNQVAGWQRAIVSPIAGTTRDTVGLDFAIHGWPFRMHDTAGCERLPTR